MLMDLINIIHKQQTHIKLVEHFLLTSQLIGVKVSKNLPSHLKKGS